MQRHGVVTTMLVASAVCVGSGRARDEGWGERWSRDGAIAIDAGSLFHWATVQGKKLNL